MSDLISRAEAIARATHEGAYGYISAQELAELPSAEPQIIRCKDCKHYNKFIATLSKTSQAVWDEYCGKFRKSVTADDFCSRAERREKE